MPEIQLGKIRPEWTQVQSGVILVDLTVSRWRASVRTNWEQLGLPARAFEKAFTPGTRRLLPDKIQRELDQLEQLARDALAVVGYKTLFGLLVPKAKYFEFKAMMGMPVAELRRKLYRSGIPAYAPADIWETTSIVDRWYQLADEIAYNRDVLVDEVAALYDDALEDVWRRQEQIRPLGRPLTPEEQQQMDAWRDIKKAGIIAGIPSAEAIKASFRMTWTVAEVETPPEVLKQAKLEELEQQQRDLQRAIAQAQDQATLLELQRQQERIKLEQAIVEEIARTRADVGQKFEQAINDIIAELHGQIYELVLDQLEYLDENGRLHSRSVGRIRNLVDLVRNKLAGLTDETTILRACDELEQLATSGLATRQDAATHVRSKLREVGTLMKADLVSAGVPSRSGREFGIPDKPKVQEVVQVSRQQRTLDLDAEISSNIAPLQRGKRQVEIQQG